MVHSAVDNRHCRSMTHLYKCRIEEIMTCVESDTGDCESTRTWENGRQESINVSGTDFSCTDCRNT